MAEKYYAWSPYNYVRGNPIIRIDPNGLTDYTINKKNGEVTQVGVANDEPDRVLKTYSRKSKQGQVKYKKNGEAKVAFGGIEKGILKDGMDLKGTNNIIEVCKDGQCTVTGVEDFALKLSEYVGAEIGGASFKKEGETEVTLMTLGGYKNSGLKGGKVNHGHASLCNYFDSQEEMDQFSLYAFFHTHPSTNIDKNDRTRPSKSADIPTRNSILRMNSSVRFFIITAPLGYGQPNQKIEYTTGYD